MRMSIFNLSNLDLKFMLGAICGCCVAGVGVSLSIGVAAALADHQPWGLGVAVLFGSSFVLTGVILIMRFARKEVSEDTYHA